MLSRFVFRNPGQGAPARLGIAPGITHYNILSSPIVSERVSGFLT
jgi:hypothetical protein